TGKLRVTAPSGLASWVARAGTTLLRAHRRVSLELITDDESLDILGRGLDLAVRLAPMADSSLVATKLGVSAMIFVASPRLARGVRTLDQAVTSLGYVSHAALARDALEV